MRRLTYVFIYFTLMGIEFRTMCMEGKLSLAGLHHQPF